MPIIDDQTRGTDRQPAPRWAWIIAIVVFCVFWLSIAILVLLGQYQNMSQQSTATVASATRSVNSSLVQQAAAARANNDWGTADASIDAIGPDAELDYMDKHTYLRIGALSKAKNGMPVESAKFYDRFLTMGTQVQTPACQSCHSGGTVPPTRVADLETSQLGAEYWRQLKAAGTLDETREQLRKQWKNNPNDPRLNLLLFHLEKRSSKPGAAVKHAEVLRTIQSK